MKVIILNTDNQINILSIHFCCEYYLSNVLVESFVILYFGLKEFAFRKSTSKIKIVELIS